MKKTITRVRLILVCIVYLGLACALLVRSAILAIGQDNRMRANLTVMNRSPESFVALGEQTARLEAMTASIDKYSLGEIKTALSDTVLLVRKARTEFLAQYDAWIVVRGQTSKDRDSFLEFKSQLDETKNLQDAEIVRLKKSLDESSKNTWPETVANLVVAFVAGIVSSLIASHIYARLERRAAEKKIKESE